MHTLMPAEYRALAAIREKIRIFLGFSSGEARRAGLLPAQQHLLFVVAAHDGDTPPTVGELARKYRVRHHSLVGLLDRLEERGLLARERGGEDRRQVHVRLTSAGREVMERLALSHRAELRAAAPALVDALGHILRSAGVC